MKLPLMEMQLKLTFHAAQVGNGHHGSGQGKSWTRNTGVHVCTSRMTAAELA